MSPPDDTAEQRAIATVHEGKRLVDQALGAAAFGRGFPFHAAPDRHAGIDQAPCDLVRRRSGRGWGSQEHIEYVEQEVEASPLKCRRPERAVAARGRRAGEAPIEPPGGTAARLDRRVAHDHISERLAGGRIAQPEVMWTIDVAENDMATIGQCTISEDDGPVADVEWRRVGDVGRRGVEDDGRGRD